MEWSMEMYKLPMIKSFCPKMWKLLSEGNSKSCFAKITQHEAFKFM